MHLNVSGFLLKYDQKDDQYLSRGINRKSRKVSQLTNEPLYQNPEKNKVILFTFIESKFFSACRESRYTIGQNCHIVSLLGEIFWASRPTAAEQTCWSYTYFKTTTKAAGGGQDSHPVKSGGVASENEMASGSSEACYGRCAKMLRLPDQQGPPDQVKSGVPRLPLSDRQRLSVLSPSELLLSPPTAVSQQFWPRSFPATFPFSIAMQKRVMGHEKQYCKPNNTLYLKRLVWYP